MTRIASLESDLRLNSAAFESGVERVRRQFKLASDSVAAEAAQMARSVERSSGSMSTRLAAIGPQIQDLAVQIGGGTSALVAFSQQLPQAASAFGPWGAAIGTGVAVLGALTGGILAYSKSSAEAESAMKRFEVSQGLVDKALSTSATSAETLVTRYGALGKEMLKLREMQRQAAREAAEEAAQMARTQSAALFDTLPRDLERLRSQVSGAEFSLLPDSAASARRRARDAALASTAELGDALRNGLSPTDALAGVKDTLKEFPELASQLDPIVTGLTSLAQASIEARKGLVDLNNSGTAAVADMADAQGKALANAKMAAEQEEALAAALKRGTAAYDAQKDAIERQNALRSVGLDLSSQEGRALDAYIARQQRAAEAQDQFKQGLKDQASLLDEIMRTVEASDAAVGARWEKQQAEAERLAEQRARDAQQAQRDMITAGQRQAEAMLEPVKNAARSMQSAIADGIYLGFDAGADSAVRFGNVVLEVAKRTAAQIGALAIMSPSMFFGSGTAMQSGTVTPGGTPNGGGAIAAPLGFAGLFGSGGGSTLASTFPSVFGSTPVMSNGIAIGASPNTALSAFGSTSLSGLMLAGGLGYLGGSMFGPMLGLNGTGSGIGAGLGATAGFMFGGPAGAVAGGVLGGAAGGLFGNFLAGSHDDNAQSQLALRSGVLTAVNSNPDPNNLSTSAAIGQELAALRQSLASLGATFNDIAIEVRAGLESGYRLRIPGASSSTYDSAEELSAAALKTLLQNATGLSATQQLVARNTKATSAAGIASDLQFASELEALAKGPINEFRASLDALSASFEPAIARAKELGLSTAELERQQAEQMRSIRSAANQNLRLLAGELSETDLAIRQTKATYADAIETAREMGKSEAFITSLKRAQRQATNDLIRAENERLEQEKRATQEARERARAEREASEQHQADLLSQIRANRLARTSLGANGEIQSLYGFMNPLRAYQASLSTVEGTTSPTSLFSANQAAFMDVKRRAWAGDQDALASYAGIAEAYQRSAYELYGSTDRYQAIIGNITATTDKIVDKYGDLEQKLLDKFGDVSGNIIEQSRLLDRRFTEMIQTFREELNALRRDLRLERNATKG